MDYYFLNSVAQVMPHLNIKTDRAMSNLLGQHDNFISRIKTGVQSVPSTVWDIFNDIIGKFLSENNNNNISSSIHMNHMQALALSHNTTLLDNISSAETINHHKDLNTDYKKDLETANEKIMLLTSQLADKERLIQILLDQASKK